MAKTNTFMSVVGGVVITPSTGSAVTVTQVLDVSKTRNVGLVPWRADGTPFPTQMAVGTMDRGVVITSGDLAAMVAVPLGVACSVVWTTRDAINGVVTGSGAITETLTHAYVVDTPSSGPTNQFAGGTISFMCGSADGTTDPYSFAQA
jgi:hypothetical protein